MTSFRAKRARQKSRSGAGSSGPRTTVSGCIETIPNVADCLDVRGVTRVGFYFCAKRRHASIHAAIVDHDVVAPHAIENLVSSERAARAFRQEFQEPKLLRGQGDLFAIPEEFVRGQIQFAVAEVEYHGRDGLTTAQEGFRARQQLTNA